MIVQSNGLYDNRDQIVSDLKECTVNEFILLMAFNDVIRAWVFESYNCKQVFIGFDDVNNKYYFDDRVVHHFSSSVKMNKKEWLLLIWSELNLDVPDILTSNTNREESNNE